MPDSDPHSRAATLFLALTRPPLFFGVPFEGALANFIGTFYLGAELSGPTLWRCPIVFWIIIGVPTHFAMRMWTSRNYHWAREFILAIVTAKPRALRSFPAKPPKLWRAFWSFARKAARKAVSRIPSSV